METLWSYMSAAERIEKTSNITIFLFGKPAWEMNLEGADAGYEMVEEIDKLSSVMGGRLREAARILKKLLDSGWSGQGCLYDISMYKDQTRAETERELVRLGINPSDVSIEEEDLAGEDC
jgi:hypothetical protein